MPSACVPAFPQVIIPYTDNSILEVGFEIPTSYADA